jgi:hypothetical protein
LSEYNNIEHHIWVESGKVKLANIADDKAIQTFYSKSELDVFIERLLNARDKAFPSIEEKPKVCNCLSEPTTNIEIKSEEPVSETGVFVYVKRG